MVSGDTPLAADRHRVKGRCRVTAHDVVFLAQDDDEPRLPVPHPSVLISKTSTSTKSASREISASKSDTRLRAVRIFMSRFLQTLPEFLTHTTLGKRFEEAVIGKQFSEHWYNPRALGNAPTDSLSFGLEKF